MNICFLCDLHLGYNKNTVQYEAFDYACADISRKRPDLVVKTYTLHLLCCISSHDTHLLQSHIYIPFFLPPIDLFII